MLYNAPYSPQLNPINLFSKLKLFFEKISQKMRPLIEIYRFRSKEIIPEHCTGYLFHLLTHLDKCMKKEYIYIYIQ